MSSLTEREGSRHRAVSTPVKKAETYQSMEDEVSSRDHRMRGSLQRPMRKGRQESKARVRGFTPDKLPLSSTPHSEIRN